MANVTVKVDTVVLDGIIRNTPRRVEMFLDQGAESVKNDVKSSFLKRSPGKMYMRGNKIHVASRPGDAPNVDMGALIGSIDWEETEKMTRKIHDGVLYGKILEMEKNRPWLGPAMERERMRIHARARAFGLVKG